MREKLSCLNNKKLENLTGVISKRGSHYNNGKKERFVCIQDICNHKGTSLTDHVWIKLSNDFKGLVKGSQVKFSAEVVVYYKKIKGILEKDYAFTNVKINK